MLGDGELPSYEEPPCQECSPVPDYCSTGQTVLDPCGCCEECAEGLECVDNSEDPETVPGVCERTLDGCCDRKVRKRDGLAYVVDKEEGIGFCMEGCMYRKEGVSSSPKYCFTTRESHRFECRRN